MVSVMFLFVGTRVPLLGVSCFTSSTTTSSLASPINRRNFGRGFHPVRQFRWPGSRHLRETEKDKDHDSQGKWAMIAAHDILRVRP